MILIIKNIPYAKHKTDKKPQMFHKHFFILEKHISYTIN